MATCLLAILFSHVRMASELVATEHEAFGPQKGVHGLGLQWSHNSETRHLASPDFSTESSAFLPAVYETIKHTHPPYFK